MTKCKIIIYTLILICAFSFLWFFLSRNYLAELDSLGIQGMLYLTSGYAGYNCIISHGSIYTMIFLFGLQMFLPNNSIHILIRKRRTDYVLYLYKRILLATLHYVAIFLGVMVVLIVLFESKQMLCKIDFFSGVVILFIYLLLYYFFIGTIFCFGKLIIVSNSKSIVYTIIISIALLGVNLFRHIWTPVAVMDVFDLLISGVLFLEDVCINVFSMVVIICAICYIINYLFKEKDILNEEK